MISNIFFLTGIKFHNWTLKCENYLHQTSSLMTICNNINKSISKDKINLLTGIGGEMHITRNLYSWWTRWQKTSSESLGWKQNKLSIRNWDKIFILTAVSISSETSLSGTDNSIISFLSTLDVATTKSTNNS